MPYADIRDARLYYETYGDGPPLVVLHPGLGSTRDWRPQIPFFSEHYQVVAIDRRGYGRSSPRESFPFDFLEQDAQDLAELLDRLGVGPAHIIGHSDGGSVAMILAAERPDLVRLLVLEATHAYTDEPTVASLERLGDVSDFSPAFRAYLEKRHGGRWQDLAAKWLARWRGHEWRAWDIRDRLSSIQAPALVIHGAEDDQSNIQQAQTMVELIPDAELWVVPGVGHAPHREKSEEFNRRVLGFMDNPEESDFIDVLATSSNEGVN